MIVLVIIWSKLSVISLIKLTFQMVGTTRSSPNDFGANGNGDLPPPPPMTPTEAFMATQTEVLRQILQTQQQIAQQMNRGPPHGANHEGPNQVTTYA
jgi:catalase (peroxidase I)